MANINPGPVNRVIINRSKIPIFTRKLTNLKPWLTVLKKKEQIYKLIDPELINLAYDFSNGIMSGWIGDYFDDHQDISSKELFEQISASIENLQTPLMLLKLQLE